MSNNLKWEDSLFARIATLLLCLFGLMTGILFVARAPGPMKVAGAILVIGSIYACIKLMRVIKTLKNESKQ
jgi:hypothetical protein